MRLAYVAATRARDLLVAPVCGDEPIDGRLEVLNPALYPADAAKRQPSRAFGCPELGEDSVLGRGVQGVAPPGGSVRPGLHYPRVGGHAVAWWDPAVLALDVEEQMGLRQQRILEADQRGIDAARGEENYARWKETRSAAVAQASRPSIQVQTVTALARGIAAGEINLARVQIETVPRVGPDRPGGRRFGVLVHAVLAAVDPDASPDEIRELRKRMQGLWTQRARRLMQR